MAVAAGLVLGLWTLPAPARGQSVSPRRLEAINEAIEQANTAALRAAASAARAQPLGPDGRRRPGTAGYVGPAPQAFPAGAAGAARPKGPGGKSVSTVPAP